MRFRTRSDLLTEVMEEFVQLQGYVTLVVPGEGAAKIDADRFRKVRRRLQPRREGAELRLLEAPETR